MKICPLCFERIGDEVLRCPRDTTVLLELGEATSPLIGKVAAERFLVLELIGKGGMASVFLAYQLSMSRLIALKVLPATEMTDPVVIERFLREARSTAQLSCPHTIVVYDSGQLATGELFIAMELLSGPTLEMVVKQSGRLPPDRVIRLAGHVCASLEEAHQLGMIHRDIKPRNIIVEQEGTRDERAKVLDFGLVKLLENGDFALTRSGVIHGTPPYMAPETWSPEYGGATPATDIYALGASMYEMLAGQQPFRANSMPGFARMHCFDPVPSLPGAGEDPVLAKLDVIIQRCLDKDPEHRYESADSMRLDLDRVLEQAVAPTREVILADTFPSQESQPRESRASRTPIVIGAVVTLLAGALLLDFGEEEAAPVQPPIAAPPPAPTPVDPPVAPKKKPRAIARPSLVRQITVTGALEESSARRTIEGMGPDLARCMGTRRGEVTLRLFVRPDGSTSAVRVTPGGDDGARFRTCFEPVVLRKSFDSFEGPFSTVTVNLAR